MNFIRKFDPIFLGIVIFFVLALIGGVFFAFKMGGKPLQVYSKDNPDKPKAEISATTSDFGEMKVSDIKTADFFIKNSGSKKLQLTNVSSSCNCTFAEITINNVKSPRFSMHSTNSWLGEVDPSTEAKVTVIYQPSIMPVQGKVERTVSLKTNDPEKTDISFKITATVENN